ncbi:MAG: SGNH/GDSL hydrolase family protein [Polyangiales bacterium]
MDRERLERLSVVISLLATLAGCNPNFPFIPPDELEAGTDAPADGPTGIPVGPAPDANVPDANVPDAGAPDAPADVASEPPRPDAAPDAAAPDQPRPDVTVAPDGTAVPDAPRDVAAPIDVTAPPPDVTAPPPDVTAPPPDVTAPPPDVTAPPPDVSLPPPDGGAAVDPLVAVPAFDAATIARVRELRVRGAAMGMRPNVFAKIGDSITESASFLYDIGQGWYVLGPYGALEPTIAYFRATRFADGSNSLSHASSCAMGGWIARYALAMDPMSALRNELSYTRPGYAVVMYGTNDLDRMPPSDFLVDMNRILDIIEGNGTVPVLSTIPDRLDRPDAAGAVPGYNDAIRGLAAARHLPLMDYWRALQPLPRRGVDLDGIHPSAYIASGDFATGVLTPTALQYGYNMRNLVTLLALDRLRALP